MARAPLGKPVFVVNALDPSRRMPVPLKPSMVVALRVISVWLEHAPISPPPMSARSIEPRVFAGPLRLVFKGIVLPLIPRVAALWIIPMACAPEARFAKMGCAWPRPAKAAAIYVPRVHFAMARALVCLIPVSRFTQTGFVKIRHLFAKAAFA